MSSLKRYSGPKNTCMAKCPRGDQVHNWSYTRVPGYIVKTCKDCGCEIISTRPNEQTMPELGGGRRRSRRRKSKQRKTRRLQKQQYR